MCRNFLQKDKGFTLLVAIVTTSILLIVSFVVSNIALKQLVLATSSQESQYAFYNADSGIECATYWDLKDPTSSPFSTSTSGSITCNSQTFSVGGGVSNPVSTFTLNLPKGCAVVRVTKLYSSGLPVTNIDSRGYNTCVAGATRKYERGVTSNFVGGNYVDSPDVTPPPDEPTIASSLTSVAAGESNPVSWNFLDTIPPNPVSSNWIGLYGVSAGNSSSESGIYAGTCTSSEGSVPGVSGTCGFTIPLGVSAGDYEFRLFESEESSILATSLTFSVETASCSPGTGGTITNISGFRVHTFISNGTFVAPVGTCANSVEVLVVGGGGGGGGVIGGGGGAGGVIGTSLSLDEGNTYPVVVGAGGAGGFGWPSSPEAGTGGGNSTFAGLVSLGGGEGAGHSESAGSSGGSGGGGARGGTAGKDGLQPGSASGGLGNDGGDTTNGNNYGGGGGGAGAVGGEANGGGGAGGVGTSSSITGSATFYAGGGGGGTRSGSGSAGSGGSGGGGTGSSTTFGATSGTANTGGGGGGAGYNGDSSNMTGGSGGSGIVIIRYPL